MTYTESEYEDFLIDRWQATKDGLQATFISGGREVSAPEAVREIIKKAAPGMRKLGASVEDLVVIPRMLEKRQTQADFQLAYLRQNPDLISFTHAVANALRVDGPGFEIQDQVPRVFDPLGSQTPGTTSGIPDPGRSDPGRSYLRTDN